MRHYCRQEDCLEIALRDSQFCEEHNNFVPQIVEEEQGENTMKNQTELTGYCQVVGCMNHIPSTNESPYCGLHMGEVSRYRYSPLKVEDYKLAIDAMSACNASGLINSMAQITSELWEIACRYHMGTDFVNHHPILQLYVYQLAHLSHGREPIEWDGFSLAYKYCKQVVAGNIDPNSNWMESINTCYHK